ncbi:MAG: glycosyltransferase family 2 protein, partial [Planctomycetota bacterium]
MDNNSNKPAVSFTYYQTQRGNEGVNQKSPKISIVMACHNAADFLAETMDTILAQTLDEWELLATDDASTDQTRTILESYAAKDSRIHLWFFDDKKGPYIRRNFMIEQAKATFISIHDADDLMAPDKLDVFYDAINRDERLGIVGSFDRRFLDVFCGEDFGDLTEWPIVHEELLAKFLEDWALCWHGSAIIRKSLFETIGLYDELSYEMDSFWLAKAGVFSLLTGQTRFEVLPKCLTFKRQHAQSQTGRISIVDPRNRRARLKEYWRHKLKQIIEEALENQSINVAEILKECSCTDFIAKFKHLFDQWESAPVDDAMVEDLISRVRWKCRQEQYVSVAITLDTLEQMSPGVCHLFPNLSFIRALAYYAIGEDGKAGEYARQEMNYFKNNNTKVFLDRYLKPGNSPLNASQRRAHVRPFVDQMPQIRIPESRSIFLLKPKGIFSRIKKNQFFKNLYMYWIIRRSGLFDRQYYLKQCPDLASKGPGPLKHYLRCGWSEGRNPNEFFDTEWYLENYPDVKQSNINPLYHYLKYGWKQNKNPSKNFSTALYFLYNPDAELSGMNPLAHYLKYGQDKRYEIFAVLPDRAKKAVLLSRIQNYNQSKGDSLENR